MLKTHRIKQDCVNIVLASCIFHKRDMTRRHHTWNVPQQRIITMQHTLSENSIRSNSMTMLWQKSTLCTLLSIKMMLWEQQHTALVNCIFHFRTKEKHCSISSKPQTKIMFTECMLQEKFFLIAENQQKFQKEYATFHQPPIKTLSLRYTLWANIIAHSIIQKLKNTLSVLRLNTTIQMHSIFLEKCICLKIKTKWLKSASVSAL